MKREDEEVCWWPMSNGFLCNRPALRTVVGTTAGRRAAISVCRDHVADALSLLEKHRKGAA